MVQISELRGIAPDNIPLSPAKGQKTFGIHFTWKHDHEGVYKAVKEVQSILSSYEYRAHWGKVFHPDPRLFATFGDDLFNLVAEIESTDSHKFLNCWSERVLYNRPTCSQDSNYERWVASLTTHSRHPQNEEL